LVLQRGLSGKSPLWFHAGLPLGNDTLPQEPPTRYVHPAGTTRQESTGRGCHPTARLEAESPPLQNHALNGHLPDYRYETPSYHGNTPPGKPTLQEQPDRKAQGGAATPFTRRARLEAESPPLFLAVCAGHLSQSRYETPWYRGNTLPEAPPNAGGWANQVNSSNKSGCTPLVGSYPSHLRALRPTRGLLPVPPCGGWDPLDGSYYSHMARGRTHSMAAILATFAGFDPLRGSCPSRLQAIRTLEGCYLSSLYVVLPEMSCNHISHGDDRPRYSSALCSFQAR
jgi:hypothetical protein